MVDKLYCKSEFVLFAGTTPNLVTVCPVDCMPIVIMQCDTKDGRIAMTIGMYPSGCPPGDDINTGWCWANPSNHSEGIDIFYCRNTYHNQVSHHVAYNTPNDFNAACTNPCHSPACVNTEFITTWVCGS